MLCTVPGIQNRILYTPEFSLHVIPMSSCNWVAPRRFGGIDDIGAEHKAHEPASHVPTNSVRQNPPCGRDANDRGADIVSFAM